MSPHTVASPSEAIAFNVGANRGQLEEISPLSEIQKYDWNVDTAYAVMMAESAGSSTVVNSEAHEGCRGSIGLFQIACIHDDTEKLKDPEYNVRRAYELWSQYGWDIWGAYSNGSYKKYL